MAGFDWKDSLHTASFRGIEFHSDSSTVTVGRRGGNHEFIGREVPYAEDTGRKQRIFPLKGFLVGGGETDSEGNASTHYMTARDKLIKACEETGSGELIHPYYGKMEVVCRSLTVSETKTKGRMCNLAFSFVEAGSRTGAVAHDLANSNIKEAVAYAGKTIASDVSGFIANAKDKSQKAIAAIKAGANAAGKAIDSVHAAVKSVRDFKNGIKNALQSYNTLIARASYAMRDIAGLANEFRRLPDELVAQFQENIGLLRDAGVDTRSAFKQLLAGFDATEEELDLTTPSRTRDARQQRLTRTMYDVMFVTMSAEFAGDIDFQSNTEIESVRSELIATIDILIARVSDDIANPLADALGALSPKPVFGADLFIALQNLRTAVLSELTRTIDDATTVEHVSQYECALVTVYRASGGVSGYMETVTNNSIDNPAVMVPGDDVQVFNG